MARSKKTNRSPRPKSPAEEATPLSKLFGANSPAVFLEENWPNKPRVFHHQQHLAPEIWQLADLQSLEQALGIAVPSTIFVNLPDHDEEYNQIQISNPEDVKKAYACKMGISMEPDLGKLTELIFWIRSIQRELGLSVQTYGRCNIYAIPDGGRTACHYDQNINLVCQITGEKIWELAPNTQVLNPMTRHTMGTPADPSTEAFAQGPLPLKMPEEGRVRVVLKPGSVLFVPRGYWHQTFAKGASMALNFTYDQVSWAQVFSSAICDKLLKDEKWRSVAYGLMGEGPLTDKAQAEFEALLGKSADLMKEIGFDDLA